MNSERPIVTAILSYGMSGEVFHAPLLEVHPGFRMKTILQRKSDTSKQYYPKVTLARSLEEVLHDPEIELVIVNTTNDTHFDFTAKALEAGKHVVVEKPFTNTVEDALKLIALAKKKNKMLSVFQSRRWDGAFMTLQKIIDSAVLGKIVEYEAHYDRFRNYIAPNTWKEVPGPGSGILYNLGSHLLDQVLVLFGKPESVSARIGTQRPGGRVDDFYDLRLEYEGLNVIVKSSYLVREPGPLYIVHGVNGSFVKYGIDPQEEALKLHQIPGSPGWGTEPEKFWGKLNTEIGGLHYEGKIETLPGNLLGYYQNIYEVIREGKELTVKPEQAMQVIQLIEAAVKSNKERKLIPY
ncbi:MAG TPA: Gfo/Idh/MocA family oxidoreductase [Cyclobacteriaceae bacterium]|nr:Gfo/Idh/MocA family oxidoreductase [Cyclobacteriaceae bacterium]